MAGTLYTLGYTEPEAAEKLAQLMADPDMLLVDIRLYPNSRWAFQWNKKALRNRYPGRYQWLGESLGNLNYKAKDREKGIQLAHPEWGKVVLLDRLSRHDIVLLCACKNYETCHRKTVVELLSMSEAR